MAPEISKRAPIIEFQRQLLPQPPKDAEPYFCLINTLIFYENGTHKEVWRQLIPEVDLLGIQTLEEWNALEKRHGQYMINVGFQERWGWVLKFRISHEDATRIWKVLFPQVNFDRALFKDIKENNETMHHLECTCAKCAAGW